MIKLFFKSLFLTLLRFFTITALIASLLYLDTSPLPEGVTVLILSYLIHFGVTFLFAKWAFHTSSPSWADASMVAAVFVLFGTALEVWLSAFITRNTFFSALRNYNWQSLVIVLFYIMAVFLAAWHSRRSAKKSATPVGMV